MYAIGKAFPGGHCPVAAVASLPVRRWLESGKERKTVILEGVTARKVGSTDATALAPLLEMPYVCRSCKLRYH